LDEPTNHLDMDSRQVLVEAIAAFEGAVILVSHDPQLVELIADRFWLVSNGGVTPFDGDLEDYRRHLLDQRRKARSQRTVKIQKTELASRKAQRQDAALKRQATAPLRRAAEAAEKDMENLEVQIAALEKELSDPALYDGPADKLTALQVRHGELKAALRASEEAWLSALEQLESAGAS
ncbi:MAG: ABC transporter ATP-binding protein, partial [Kiloniellales bacterium]|nr:ABC transporter ATP-binding protein [Kiloniellales bacterium]